MSLLDAKAVIVYVMCSVICMTSLCSNSTYPYSPGTVFTTTTHSGSSLLLAVDEQTKRGFLPPSATNTNYDSVFLQTVATASVCVRYQSDGYQYKSIVIAFLNKPEDRRR